MDAEPVAAPPRVVSALRANYTLGVLVVVFTLNFMDRTVANVLIDPIKHELQLSDAAMGMIVGFGFTLLYALLGIPVGSWSDRHNRRNVISLGLLVWTGFTALSGVAWNTASLAVSRIGVGVGESCGWAPAISLVSDYFPRERRARAVGILVSAATLGTALGIAVGGAVGQHYGWRAAFLVAGIPGFIMAAVLRFTVRELPHGAAEAAGTDTRAYKVAEVLRFVLSQKSAVMCIVGGLALGLYAYTYTTWTPSLLRRVHHMSGDEIAYWAGGIHLVVGILGGAIGGVITDIAGRRDARWLAWSPALMFVAACPAALLLVLSDNRYMALLGLAVQTFCASALYGPCWAIIQTLVRVRMRAVTLSIAISINTLLGLGLGTPLIGLGNDLLTPIFGAEAIRWSLTVPAFFTLFGALMFALAARHVPRDMARAQGAP